MLSANQNVAKIDVTLLGDMQIKSAHGLILIEKIFLMHIRYHILKRGNVFIQ